jgi:glycosyltransferase involved in cell wall biosynthesis
MKFSIVTPAFRSLKWLQLCVASVADQQGASFEHIVQDSCSDDGTQEWLKNDTRVKAFVEKDSGMYDGLNRGLRRATGEILAHLNSDEQYLPGALAAVLEVFERKPDVDIVLTHAVVTDCEGKFVCCRKSMVPSWLTIWSQLPTLTCALFFRRRVLDDFNLYFDVRWRDLGDDIWMKEALRLRLKMALLPRYTSVFADTGENLGLKANALREKGLSNRMAPAWARWLPWPLFQMHRLRAAFNGVYWERPFTYAAYTLASPSQRTEFHVAKPTGIWWKRHESARRFRLARA